jgi:hypothetical protein
MRRLVSILGSFAALAAGMAANGTPASGTAVPLAVSGGVSATPWVAAEGPFVAAVWGVTREGRADVYSAVSRDGGASFDSPVRVLAASCRRAWH